MAEVPVTKIVILDNVTMLIMDFSLPDHLRLWIEVSLWIQIY